MVYIESETTPTDDTIDVFFIQSPRPSLSCLALIQTTSTLQLGRSHESGVWVYQDPTGCSQRGISLFKVGRNGNRGVAVWICKTTVRKELSNDTRD